MRAPREFDPLRGRRDRGRARRNALATHAFEPHRHDTYAIGISLNGVLRFRYRGSSRICLPGQIHVLHPDVLHDGGPGTADGLATDPVRRAGTDPRSLDGGELPFVADPVQNRAPATRRLASLLSDIDEPITDLSRVDIATIIADTLRSLSGPRDRHISVDFRAVSGVRDYLATHPATQTPASTLEQLAGLDRFAIARQFRKAFGTSPDRYRTMRRLELARSAIESGAPLAQAAAQAGFADQSHMTRQFKRAYGLTPATWAKTVVS